MTTWQDMRERCLEALEVYRRMPDRVGPARVASAWPEISQSMQQGGHSGVDNETKVRTVPDAEMISRADAFTALASATLTETDRREMWTWAAIKLSKRATLRGYCEKLGLKDHEYRRQIEAIFQKLALNASGNPAVRFLAAVDRPRESEDEATRSEQIALKRDRQIVAWRPDEAEPAHLPDSRSHRRLIRDLLKRQKGRGQAP